MCGQRQSDWRDDDGKELRDPPFEVVETLCPGCEAIGYHQEEAEESKAVRHGVRLAFKRVPGSGQIEEHHGTGGVRIPDGQEQGVD